MSSQLELDVVVEESRQKLAEETIEEAEYLKDASKISGFCRSRSKLAMAVQDNQSEEDRTRSWGNDWAHGTGPKCQPGTCFRFLFVLKHWTAFQQESNDDS